MQLWQMDVMGGVRLEDGAQLKVVTGIDQERNYRPPFPTRPKAGKVSRT